MTCGLNPALHLVLYNPQAKNGFYIFLKSRKTQKIFLACENSMKFPFQCPYVKLY